MKSNQVSKLAPLLDHIKRDLGLLSRPESNAAIVDSVDEIIARLVALRRELTNPELQARLLDIEQPLSQVIDFLEFAKTNDLLPSVILGISDKKAAPPKRTPIEIPPNLTNDQIRNLLERDLSRQELKLIADQRGISLGKLPNGEVKQRILAALDRQEGYERLGNPRVIRETSS